MLCPGFQINTICFRFGFSKLNMLFRYLDINCHTGIMLCSPSIYNEHNYKTKEIFNKIEEKFNSTVTVIRSLFNDSNQVISKKK